mgnify:CR=1 FL=1
MRVQPFQTLKHYNKKNLPKDILAGIIIMAVSIPISMGYAQIAGLPAVYGLYGSVFPIILFGLFSTSPQFIFGVDAAPAALVGSAIVGLGIESGTKEAMAAVPVLTALLLMAFAGVLLQRYSPAFALLLSLGAAVWLLLRLAQPLRGVLQAMAQLGQRTNAQAFSCLLRSAGILLLADYVRTLCEEAGADALAWCAGLAGRCLVLAAVWPLLEQIFQTIWGLAG